MKTHLIAAALIFAATGAKAELVAQYFDKIDRQTALVIQLSDQKAPKERCGRGGMYLVVVSATDSQMFPRVIPYGNGCWASTKDGKVLVSGEAFNNGPSFTMVYNAKDFEAGPALTTWRSFVVGPDAPEQPTGKAKVLIDRVDRLATICRDGNGETQARISACGEVEPAINRVRSEGWCWGPDDAIGADKHWMRCR